MSSGRSTRKGSPLFDLTTLPSGSPITPSWAIAPRWVWNSPPVASTIV